MSEILMPNLPLGEWVLLLVHLPGKGSIPAGIVLVDTAKNELHVKVADRLDGEDAELLSIWSQVPEELMERAQQFGALKVLAWLEDTASHTVEVSSRQEVLLANAEKTLNALYEEHVLRQLRQRIGAETGH
jgi:hypothetical protein